ncbi:MAG: hypothetical protein OXK82_04700 [Deltaproteobacteria bacterium]|nr:hypothetical protein [Deltaproteobacteria bacterium]
MGIKVPIILWSPLQAKSEHSHFYWLSRRARPWSRTDPDCHRIARRRIREAVRFIRVSDDTIARNRRPKEC